MNKKCTVLNGIIGLGLLISGCTIDEPMQVSSIDKNSLQASVDSITQVATPTTNSLYTPGMVQSINYPDNLEIAIRNDDHFDTYYWNAGYNTWILGGSGGINIASDPALCATVGDGYLNVVVRESSNKVMHYWRNGKQVWSRDALVYENCHGSPAMVCNSSSYHLEVLTRINNGADIIHRWSPNGVNWYTCGTLPHPGYTIQSDPALTQLPGGKLQATAIGSNRVLYWELNTTTWQWELIDTYEDKEAYGKRPAIARRGSDNVEIFFEVHNGPESAGTTFLTLNDSKELVYDDFLYAGFHATHRCVAATNMGNEIHLHVYSSHDHTNKHYKIIP